MKFRGQLVQLVFDSLHTKNVHRHLMRSSSMFLRVRRASASVLTPGLTRDITSQCSANLSHFFSTQPQ